MLLHKEKPTDGGDIQSTIFHPPLSRKANQFEDTYYAFELLIVSQYPQA